MLVQPGLCRICLETTSFVFPCNHRDDADAMHILLEILEQKLSIYIVDMVVYFLSIEENHIRYYHIGKYLNYDITKTCLCNGDPLIPNVYIARLGYTWVHLFFLIFAPKH